MKKLLAPILLIGLFPVGACAQFTDPGFEQGGNGWVMHCPEWAWPTSSSAPYGGNFAMAIQATSPDFASCPSGDPGTGLWPPPPRFYQLLPQVTTADVVRVKFLARLEEGIPVPIGSSVEVTAITVDGNGVLQTIPDPGFQVGEPLANWQEMYYQITVPVLAPGQVFGIGFAAHTFGGGNGVVHFDNMALVVEGSGALLNAKAWLDGAYVPGANLMRDDLRTAGLIPASQPMSPPGAATTPVGGETIGTGVLGISGNNAIVDWAWIDLRFGQPVYPYETYAKRNVLIQRDGDIVDMDGTSPVLLPLKAGNCRVVVRHRNHLGVMSAEPLNLNSTPVLFDASATNSPLFSLPTPNTDAARKVVGTTRTLWPGDAWSLGAPYGVKYTGSGNDRDPVLYALGGNIPNSVVTSYHRSDINLDGKVKYTGVNNDRDIILQTIGGSTPNAVRYEQVP